MSTVNERNHSSTPLNHRNTTPIQTDAIGKMKGSITRFYTTGEREVLKYIRACSVGTVPFRSATVSIVKRGFFPF